MKDDQKDVERVFVGNYAGPHLIRLSGKETPPCFNPRRADGARDYPTTTRKKGKEPRPYTAYNRELYDAIMLFFIAFDVSEKDTRADKGKGESPTTKCLSLLTWNGDEDLTEAWALSLNTVFQKYKTNVDEMIKILLSRDPNIREFKFPRIQEKLKQRGVKDLRFM
ncbi:hypothetical protein [Pelagibius sp. Alg239-R121]|uniref:hypothetical protein n=1 Tax=Pelagibius sp. Alg239-R121 TaxID=2993448 RepID=UPI0024A74BEA|nr:hypothetical protein [Pelagibius sp. Alg239-R121]